MKQCKKCSEEHDNRGDFCSRKCANSREWSIQHKEALSKKMSGRGLGGNRWNAGSAEKLRQTVKRKMDTMHFDEVSYDLKRRRIIEEQEGKCSRCGLDEWQGSPIALEIDHKNGIGDDHRRENMEGLCPNCHSLTDTWRGRNKVTRNKVSDDELLKALTETANIRQALLSLGLAAKGNNYKRAKELRDKFL